MSRDSKPILTAHEMGITVLVNKALLGYFHTFCRRFTAQISPISLKLICAVAAILDFDAVYDIVPRMNMTYRSFQRHLEKFMRCQD